jgi:hypothetical protein
MPAGFAWRPRNLRATRLVMMTAAEQGNGQSHYKAARCRAPGGVFLFRATMETE